MVSQTWHVKTQTKHQLLSALFCTWLSMTANAATWPSRRVLTHVGTVLAVETVADCQGVVVARTILPGEAESAVLSTKHKLLGDIRGYW